jgi:hypothetical protein
VPATQETPLLDRRLRIADALGAQPPLLGELQG